ncbi:hypothetical protein DTL21_05265 [Bremerella cremea]|uniref:Uncharacterized protein n=1 Tax=Blastopirellula marina TaxID=124 RepID=A0A2S8FYU6_9BACT|nr:MULTISPECIES: FixH family protein [Pirellulaceae]PQO37355.1 hypothetical protein C5Y83_05265 [Blastopirellula marina]RCS49742.1 hypothetical protein DTL21_05265 [Bremerella cremea]
MSTVRSLDPSQTLPDKSDKEVLSGIVWGGMIIGLLVLQIVMSVGAAIFAVGSGSNDVVPDYYQKAIHFDELKAAQTVPVTKE